MLEEVRDLSLVGFIIKVGGLEVGLEGYENRDGGGVELMFVI